MLVSRADRKARRRALAHAVRTMEDGYGLTLLLTILTIFALAVGGITSISGLIDVTLAGCTLLFALSTSGARPRTMRLWQAIVVLAIVASALAIVIGDPSLSARASGGIGLAIAAVVPFVIIRHIVRSPEITYRLVIGALVVYLLIGLCYAYAFPLIADLSGQPFFVQTRDPSSATYLYFSYTTLSTVGYGDYSAAQPLGQMVAISEAISGQLYLVSIVAILVANVGHSFRHATSASPSIDVEPGAAAVGAGAPGRAGDPGSAGGSPAES